MKLEITAFADLPIYQLDVQEKGFRRRRPGCATKSSPRTRCSFFASPELQLVGRRGRSNGSTGCRAFQPQPFNQQAGRSVQLHHRASRRLQGQYDLRRIWCSWGCTGW